MLAGKLQNIDTNKGREKNKKQKSGYDAGIFQPCVMWQENGNIKNNKAL